MLSGARFPNIQKSGDNNMNACVYKCGEPPDMLNIAEYVKPKLIMNEEVCTDSRQLTAVNKWT
jgi:hypothetical protein